MLATDFHIMDRKIYMNIEKENRNTNVLVCNMPYM